MKSLEGDVAAVAFIEAKCAGFSKTDIMQYCQLDEKGYDTVAKRVRRALGRRDQWEAKHA